MSKRLRIAKKLLSDRGVIFISIDDNEQGNLRLLCDQVFDERHFVADLIWQKKFARSNDAIYFSTMHDHILCYCRKNKHESPDAWKIGLLTRKDIIPKGYSNPDNDPRGPWTSTILSAKSGSQSLIYEITTPSGRKVLPPSGRFWSCSEDTFKRYISENRIWFGKKGDGSPRKKTFLSEVQDGLRPNTMLFQDMVGHNQEGKQELKEIFDGVGVFDGPKPVRLLKHLLILSNFRFSYVLDFFAGSGTTLHAVMQLNAEDGGKRQCILCTNNENGICENVTYERNKRVINGYSKPNGEHVEGLHNNNLRYYRTDFVSRDRSTKNMRQLMRLSTDMLCIKENLYTEQKEFAGMPTFKKIYRYFADSDGKKMLIIYDEHYVEEIVKMIEKVDTNQPIKVYVFSPSEDPWEDSFEPVNEKVELCALPQAIYNTYKRILPKRKDKNIATNQEETSFTEEDSKLGGLFVAEGGEA